MNKLQGISTEDLQAELARREEERRKRFIYPDEPIGWWEVTTEGDYEGRSVKNLGTHYGHICDIALGLAGAAEYALHFQAVPKPTYQRSPRDEASISLGSIANIQSNIVTEAEAQRLSRFFGSEWAVTPDKYYQTVKVSKVK